MGITRTIKDRLVLDLQDVPGLTVRENPEDEPNVDDLEVELRTAEGLGVSEPSSLDNAIGAAQQNYQLTLYRRTATPDDDCMDTLDDIRGVVERSKAQGSNLLATPAHGRLTAPVEWAGVTEWSDVLRTSDDAKGDWGIIERIIVTVRYSYDRQVV